MYVAYRESRWCVCSLSNVEVIPIVKHTNKSLYSLKAFIYVSLFLLAHALLDPPYHLREALERNGILFIKVVSPVAANAVSTCQIPQFRLSYYHERICAECCCQSGLANEVFLKSK